MKKLKWIALTTTFTFLCLGICQAQSKYKYVFQNPAFSLEERVNDLVSRMNLQEKVSQMIYDAPAIERLGIPSYNWWNEALHGVARAGQATVFPQAIAMAATFDDSLMYVAGNVIGDEARAKHNEFVHEGKHGIYQGLTFWAPNINIFRDPRWGRGQETYGEDPYLTSRLAVNFIKGLQGDDKKYFKVIATAKHFAVHSGPETLRHKFDAQPTEKDLWETYLPAFKACVTEANVQSVMCAYNRFRGEPCCGSNVLIKQILRNKWAFKGYVVSDCWAIHDFWTTHKVVSNETEAAAMALKAGVDLNCGESFPSLPNAVKQGLIDEKLIDQAVKRLFKARFQLGMMDPPENVPYAQIPMSVVDSKEHRAAALKMARESIVLLKNNKKILPLSKNLKKIAIIGPVGDDEETLWANYSGYNKNGVTILNGIKAKLPGAKVLYETGCEFTAHFPQLEIIPGEYLYIDKQKSQKGFNAEYYDNSRLEGLPVHTQIDSNINFLWWDKAPFTDMHPDNFSVRWEGYIESPESGDFAIGCEGFYSFKMWVNDSLHFDFSSVHHPRKQFHHFHLKAGEMVKIKIEYKQEIVNHALMKLYWAKPVTKLTTERAIKAAKDADVVILCMGFNQNLEGEEMALDVEGFSGGDRTDIQLPQTQRDLIHKIQALGKPTVLLLLNGSPISTVNENKNIDALMECWYGGQSQGTAVADILFGDYNPAGRLPVTVYKSLDQLPPFEDYHMTGKTYRYFKGEPLYEFGYGLSYTSFTYKNLRYPKKAETSENAEISVEVTNTGNRDGDEVVQLYVSHKHTGEEQPIRSLKGFKRIFLKVGEKRIVKFTLTPAQMSIVKTNGEILVEPGAMEITVGGKQPDKESLRSSKVIKGEILLRGNVVKLEH
jgi:beta-glucosidase